MSQLKYYAALAGSMALAGSSVIVTKHLVHRFPVFLTSGLSLLIALMFLIPASLLKYGLKVRINGRNLSILFIQGFCGTFLFRIFLFLGLSRTSASTGGLITSSAPAIVGLLAIVALKEKIHWNKISGIVLTIGGMVVINLSGASSGGADSLPGNFLVFLAVFGESLFSIFSKTLNQELPALLKTTVVCTFAFLCFVPLSIYDLFHMASSVRFDLSIFLCLVYYGLAVTVLAFILWFRGIAGTPASTSAVFSGFMPLTSILLSAFLLNEHITVYHFLSLLLIVSGLLVTVLLRSDEKNALDESKAFSQ